MADRLFIGCDGFGGGGTRVIRRGKYRCRIYMMTLLRGLLSSY
jgi:hypothetical protein